MLKTVPYAAIMVSDQDKALDFYTNVVGFEKRGDLPTPGGPRFVTIGVKGQDFALVLWPGRPAEPEQGTAAYTIEVDDCAKEFKKLQERGAVFEPPKVIEMPFGYVARFKDPDGNSLQLREGRKAAA